MTVLHQLLRPGSCTIFGSRMYSCSFSACNDQHRCEEAMLLMSCIQCVLLPSVRQYRVQLSAIYLAPKPNFFNQLLRPGSSTILGCRMWSCSFSVSNDQHRCEEAMLWISYIQRSVIQRSVWLYLQYTLHRSRIVHSPVADTSSPHQTPSCVAQTRSA